MSIAMVGKSASYEFRWRRWALLHDTVVTHLENEQLGSRFPLFAAIGSVLGVPSIQLSAQPLASELQSIQSELAKLTVQDLVISVSTASVLYPGSKPQGARALTASERSHVAATGEVSGLEQYFASMLDSMLNVCASPNENGTIELYDA